MSKVDAGYVCIWASIIYVILLIASIGFIMYRKNSGAGHQQLEESEVEMRHMGSIARRFN